MAVGGGRWPWSGAMGEDVKGAEDRLLGLLGCCLHVYWRLIDQSLLL